MDSFMIYCDKTVTSIAEVDIMIELPDGLIPKHELPAEISCLIQEMDWEVHWTETHHELSFYGE
jgi:hypothetical protein